MKEEKLQSQIVAEFSQLYPEKRGRLFHVQNEQSNKTKAYLAKSLGIVSGVSDLIYLRNDGRLRCLELKAPGKRHSVDHLLQQIKWGELVESLGGDWAIVTSVEQAMWFICTGIGGTTAKEMRELIGGKRTYRF